MSDDIAIDLDEGVEETAAPVTAAEIDEADDRILPKGCERNTDGSVTVTLDYPVTITVRTAQGAKRSDRFDSLTFHRLTGADFNALRSTSPETQQTTLFARSARVKAAVMTVLYPKLDGADIARCGRVLETFLG